MKFALTGQDNRAAVHLSGLAAASLTSEATARSLVVHQMIGVAPDKARRVYGIPPGHEVWTALAIGRPGDSSLLPDPLSQRDLAPRQRKKLSEFVFAERWGSPSRLLTGQRTDHLVLLSAGGSQFTSCSYFSRLYPVQDVF